MGSLSGRLLRLLANSRGAQRPRFFAPGAHDFAVCDGADAVIAPGAIIKLGMTVGRLTLVDDGNRLVRSSPARNLFHCSGF
jgi:hypothetical protein